MNRLLLSGARFFSFPVLLLLCCCMYTSAFAQDGDENWADGYGLPGFDDAVQQIVVGADDTVFAFGYFQHIDGVPVNSRVVIWDGQSWSAAGQLYDARGLSQDAVGNVYATGYYFDGALGSYSAVSWENGSWQPFAVGLEGRVDELAFAPDDRIYARGYDLSVGDGVTGNLARFDGNSWQIIGVAEHSEYQYSSVDAMEVDSTGQLFITGSFDSISGVGANGIARFDDTGWHSLGEGLTQTGTSASGGGAKLAISPDDVVYVAGYFDTVDGVSLGYQGQLVSWSQNVWSMPFAEASKPIYGFYVNDMQFEQETGDLWLAGRYLSLYSNSDSGGLLVRWNGSDWEDIAPSLKAGAYGNGIYAIAQSTGGETYIGGGFNGNSGAGAYIGGFAKAVDSGWEPLTAASGSGANGNVNKMVQAANGDIYVAGRFNYLNSASNQGLMKFGNGGWSALIADGSDASGLTSMAISPEQELYVSGLYLPGGYHSIHKWDGSSWVPFGPQLNGIQTFTIGTDGAFYAMYSSYENNVSQNQAVKLEGETWVPLGGAFLDEENEYGGYVSSLLTTQDGELVVVGQFTSVGDVAASNIAVWDGAAWSALGGGVNIGQYGWIQDMLAGDDGRLYVAGRIENDLGEPALVAIWDGLAWSYLSGPVAGNGHSTALAFSADGELLVGGYFVVTQDYSSEGLAGWDGASWRAFGSGIQGGVSALESLSDGSLLVGGDFSSAGGKASSNIAYWMGSQEAGLPTIVSPETGSELTSTTATFSWVSNGTPVDEWWFYVGDAPGSSSYFDSKNLGSETSVEVVGLPDNGELLHVRLFYRQAGQPWSSIDSTYTAAESVVVSLPAVQNPVDGSTLSSDSQTVSWLANGTEVDEWWLYAGDSVGSSTYFDSGNLGDSTSVEITGLPVEGTTIYIRLYYRQSGARWSSIDVTYTAVSIAAEPSLASPVPGTVLSGVTETFSWLSNGQSVDEWWLYAGNSVGSKSYFDSGNLGDALDVAVTGLPADGTTVYVRLFYRESGASWSKIDVTYTAASGPTEPALVSPADTLTSGSQTFEWVANGVQVDQWWLYVGSAVGDNSYFDSGNLQGATSALVEGLPVDGSTVYARLYYRESGGRWSHVDSTHTASDLPAGEPEIIGPTDGSSLLVESTEFHWQANGATVDEWWLYVGDVVGGNSYFDSGNLGAETHVAVAGLPTDGSTIYARLFYRQAGERWSRVDSSYIGAGGGSPFTTGHLSDRYLVPVVEQFAAGRTAYRLDADGLAEIADIGDTDNVLRYGEFPWSVDGNGRIVADFTSVEASLTCDYAPLATLGDQLDVAVSCTTGSIDGIGKYYLSKPFSSQDLTGKTIDINSKFSVSFGANSVAAVTEFADGSQYDITYSDSTYQAVELNRTNVSAFVLLAGTIDDGLLMMWSYGDNDQFRTVEFFETTSDSWTSVYRRDRD